ncbi:MAG UNVERIFIED_CONTAM: toll/interleukin-1 receptor domain-containing protein [Planctomycetaceae bacterium]|jgi:hypothetical protein
MSGSGLSSGNLANTTDQGMLQRNSPEHYLSVFISYSRIEEQFVRGLDEALVRDGINVWVDLEEIRPSEDWVKRILAEIERIGTMLVVITPESCESRVCNLEVNHAAKMGKRLIPILRRDVPRDTLNEHLKSLHWIFFRDDDDREEAMSNLKFALNADLNWIDEQARLLVKALEWDRGGRKWTATIRGPALRLAERWLEQADETTRLPTQLHREFVASSRRATNQFWIGVSVLSVVLVALLILAPIFWQRSRSREREAIDAQLQVDKNSSPSPLDLARTSSLSQLLVRVRSSGHTVAVNEIERRLAQVPSPRTRVEVLESDPTRIGLASAAAGDKLFLWAPDRIEAFGHDGRNEVSVYRQRGGSIYSAWGDPCSDGILFEVDFDSFADAEVAGRVTRQGDRKFLKHVSEHDFDGEGI